MATHSHQLPSGAEPTREPMNYLPQLSLAERDRRWRGLRQRMDKAGFDALVLIGNDIFFDMGMTNVRYLTHIGNKLGTAVLFLADRDPIVWNGSPHSNRPVNPHFATQSWVSDIRPNPWLPELAAELRERGLDHGRIGLVGYRSAIVSSTTILHDTYLALEKALPQVRFEGAEALLEEMRLIKSDEEIAMLAKAGEISRKVVDTLIHYPKPGMTESELFGEVMRTEIANGAEPNLFFLMNSGPVEHPGNELWFMLHGMAPPTVPSRRPLGEGDMISAEWHVQYGGYLAATEFSVYLGRKAPAQLKNIHKVATECLEASVEVLQPGTTLREAWEAIRRPCEKAELDFIELGFHGHGLASPEYPCVVYKPGYGPSSMNGDGIGDAVFEEGMVLGNNIDLHDSRWKPDVGIHFGDMLVVRPGGAEKLVNVPLDFPEIGG